MEKENINIQSSQDFGNEKPEQNFGIGRSLYNNALNKLIEANTLPANDKSGLGSRLNEESNAILRQSIPYLQKAIKYYDSLNEKEKGANSMKLYQSLNTLSNVYIQLGMYEELKPIKTRIEEYQ